MFSVVQKIKTLFTTEVTECTEEVVKDKRLTRFFGKNKSWTEGLDILPFALFAGAAFTIPYALTGVFLGAEFPSLIGGLVGLAIVVTAAKRGFLVPKSKWDFESEDKWPAEWLGSLKIDLDEAGSSRFAGPVPWQSSSAGADRRRAHRRCVRQTLSR